MHMGNDVKISHGKPRQRQYSDNRASQGIQNMTTAWMNNNDTKKLSDGIVKFAKNIIYPKGIRKSPYEDLLRIKPKNRHCIFIFS